MINILIVRDWEIHLTTFRLEFYLWRHFISHIHGLLQTIQLTFFQFFQQSIGSTNRRSENKQFLIFLFFGVTCLFWLSLLLSLFFCHQVVHLIHLVFRWTRELNSHLRTMARSVTPWSSIFLFCIKFLRLLYENLLSYVF